MSFVQPPSTLQVALIERSSTREEIRPSPNAQGVAVAEVGTPNPTVLYPNVGFEVKVFDLLNPNGPPLTVIPNPQTITFEDQLSDVGSGQVTLATDDVPASILAKDNIWKVYWLGIEVFAFIGGQLQDTQIQASEEHDRVVASNGIAQWMDKMKVYPGNWPVVSGAPAPTPTQTFTNASYASILQTLFNQGIARGTLPWFTQYLWSNLVDSHNIAWTDVGTWSVDAGTSMLDLVKQYAAALPFDWHMDTQGRLALWQTAGTNRTETVKVQPIGSVISSEITTDWTNLWDVYLVEDNNQGFTEQVDTSTITTFGRRENFSSSSSTLTSTGRADLALSLLNAAKLPAIQKVVQVDVSQVGRRPYIDFFLGDTISVEFTDGTVEPARVIAIAMNGGDGVAEEAQLTLDFMLPSTSTTPTGTSSSAIDTGNTGSQVVYGDNGNNVSTVTTSATNFITLQVQAFLDTYAEVYVSIEGSASAAMTLTATIYLDGNPIRTMSTQVPAAGSFTWTPVFMLTSIPQGTHSAYLTVATSTGTFVVQPFYMQFWFEGPNLNGGLGGGGDVPMSVVDTIVSTPHTLTTAAPTLSLQGPIAIKPSDSISSSAHHPTDTTSAGTQNELWQGYFEQVATSGDDTSESSGPSFSSTSNQLEAGNDGSFTWNFSCRFVIPSPGIPSGATITRAFLAGVSYATNSGFIGAIYAEHAASPTAPTSQSDFLGRTRTTASVAWSASQTANTAIQTPSLISVIQELVTAFPGTITAIQIFVQNNASPVNGEMILQSYDDSPTNAPTLTVMWHL